MENFFKIIPELAIFIYFACTFVCTFIVLSIFAILGKLISKLY